MLAWSACGTGPPIETCWQELWQSERSSHSAARGASQSETKCIFRACLWPPAPAPTAPLAASPPANTQPPPSVGDKKLQKKKNQAFPAKMLQIRNYTWKQAQSTRKFAKLPFLRARACVCVCAVWCWCWCWCLQSPISNLFLSTPKRAEREQKKMCACVCNKVCVKQNVMK